MKKATKRPTIAFTTEVQVGLLEEQSSFHVMWHEPIRRKPWGAFVRRIFLLETALNEGVTLKEIMARWPDFAWKSRGASTLARWLAATKKDYSRLPANTKSYLRSLARFHFDRHGGQG